ncbi:hypothetical protein B0S90_1501 [Caldicellulosiruptor bescii]|uniref:Uncharacterized protein n=2 Tax=Caldicellulosiruptor bescii TaxID=31899 RepID=B9MRK5_CALBD|nr:hypothetical protein [Caldicellulosiruptor bescii]ACM60309.1 conserved hypothetical protein [Caldicellulosiruptor bescii DSM 6725]PBC87723.1 hypothetical protein B0S87_0641 [Caldicellulosiruptor bescii]PBC90656.1 hypothetical protein B0S89_1003 [Caldicellulosiruptor bescii]PBD03912.1 hypothetical protein B0S85_1536 [Caldicellulosiruptor bescii]PBD06453.1 hypothetical protein B0S90_1501 [Caldicellulosiruptor bescii]
MKYWKKLLSFILIITLSSLIFSLSFAFSFYKFEGKEFINKYFFAAVKEVISSSKKGWAVIVVLKDEERSQKIKEYLGKKGTNISNLSQIKKKKEGLFFLYSGDDRLIFVFDNLSDEGFFTFKSVHTKRVGLVLDSEFMDILEGKFNNDAKILVAKDFLQYLWKFFWALNYQLMYLNKYLIVLFTVIIIFSILEATIYFGDFKIDAGNGIRMYILKLLPTTVIVSYLFIIYSPIIVQYINHIFIFLLLFFATSLILSYFSLEKTQAGVALSGILSILIQAIFYDNYLQIISTAGYHPSFANRFYGIGNEFFAYLLGFAFVFSIVTKIPLKNLYIILGILAVFLSIPYYGINFGGLVSMLLGFISFSVINSRNKKKMIFLLLPAAILIVFAIFKNSYLFNVFSNTEVLVDTIKRKLLMNLSYFVLYPLTILLVSYFVILSILALTKNEILVLRPLEKEKIKLFIIITMFAWLLNDSGTIIVGLLLGFLNLNIYIAKMVKEYGNN